MSDQATLEMLRPEDEAVALLIRMLVRSRPDPKVLVLIAERTALWKLFRKVWGRSWT